MIRHVGLACRDHPVGKSNIVTVPSQTAMNFYWDASALVVIHSVGSKDDEIFTYGTLMNSSWQAWVVIVRRTAAAATLTGTRLFAHHHHFRVAPFDQAKGERETQEHSRANFMLLLE